MERVPAIIAAGDGKASKAILGESKAYLEIAGESMIAHVVSVLQQVAEVKEVWVVGNAPRLEQALSDPALQAKLTKPLTIVPQYRNLLENTWQTYRRLLPGAGPAGRDPANEAEVGQRVLYLSADLPFATPQEISAFLRSALQADCDFGLGLATEDAMVRFYPEKGPGGKRGIEMAYFNTAEGRLRQNNLHLVRPARLGNRQAIEDMYEHRYQKQLGQMLGLGWRILTNEGGGPRIVFYFGVMQLAMLFDRISLRGVADLLRRALPLRKIDRACSSLLGTRFRLIVTSTGGCAIDIDNEKDLAIARERFDEWKGLLALQAEDSHGALPETAKPTGTGLRVLEAGPLALEGKG